MGCYPTLALLLVVILSFPVLLDATLTSVSCRMVEVVSTKGTRNWKCLLGPDGERANQKLDIVGLHDDDDEYGSQLSSGNTIVTAHGAQITGRRLHLATSSDVRILTTTPPSKNAIQSTGSRSVLAVRVTSNDGANPLPADTLISNVFTDAVNTVERFATCSYNKLILQPFVGTLNGISIVDGMYEVTIAENTQGVDESALEAMVVSQLNSDLGSTFLEQIDHLMIFCPDNVPQFGAIADFPGKISVYDGFEGSFASVMLVHGIGHNLHLDNSSEGDEEYGDETCSMGARVNLDDLRVCFNPSKSWALGWYSDKHVSVDVLSSNGDGSEHNLVGVAEYEAVGSNSMFIKLDNGGDDFFIGFNRAIGMNVQQRVGSDEVTVTQSSGSSARSYFQAKLDAGQSFTIPNIKGSGTDARIEVMSINTATIPAVARVKISNMGTSGSEDEGPIMSFLRSFCFSKKSQVTVRGKGQISLDQLEVGDYVLSSKGFSKVWGFHHLHKDISTEFLKIYYRSKDVTGTHGALEVSSEHLLFSEGKVKAAVGVQVGHSLEGPGGKLLEITKIEKVQRDGVYAPATTSGELFVSGVRVSNYVELLSVSAFNQHDISHALIAPKRWICSFALNACAADEYTVDGYSRWAKFFIDLSHVLKTWGAAVQYIATLSVAPLVVMVYILDCFATTYDGTGSCVSIAICLLTIALIRKRGTFVTHSSACQ